MPQHSASILWSPPHTPGLVTLSTNLVVLQSDVRHGLVDLQCLGQGLEAVTYQGRRLARGLYGQNKMTFHWDMSISLIQDLANNLEINSCLQPLHIWQLPRSEMNDETTAPPKRQNFFLSKNVEDMTWIHAAAFNGDNRTPGLGTLVANLVSIQTDVRDALVDFKCLGQGLEAATDQGWWLDFKRPTDKTLDLKSSDQRTFYLTKTCKSLWLNPCKNNPEINSSLQHLHIWQLSLRWKMNDGAHHTPGLGALVANPVPSHIDVLDGRVCLQRLGQGLETETDQGWRLHPGLYRSNRDHWNPENTWHLTLTSESLWYRT